MGPLLSLSCVTRSFPCGDRPRRVPLVRQPQNFNLMLIPNPSPTHPRGSRMTVNSGS